MATSVLVQQLDAIDRHAWLHGFQHVVERDQTDGDRRDRFHLDPGLTWCGSCLHLESRRRTGSMLMSMLPIGA